MATAHDTWLTTTPDDEQAARDSRNARREAATAPALNFDAPPMDHDGMAFALAESVRVIRYLGDVSELPL